MGDITPLVENLDSNDIMTVEQVAELFHCSGETVRGLTERSWHPLPCINVGMGKKKQRLFRRTSMSRWMQEEEWIDTEEERFDTTAKPLPVQVVAASPRRRARGTN